ncbi:MAG: 1-phosphofructokinase family hexose kinase [Candidatus Hydrogenedentes bacterium]|nr:1-phosphofructokinase family hexose kinase [Candidatus Hydrogenedentota bacterium]
MFLTVTPNPCIDKTIFIPQFRPGDRVRSKNYSIIAGGKGNNVARVLRFLGFNAYALLWVGEYTGKEVIRLLKEEDKVKPIPVWTKVATRTITTVYEEEKKRQTAFFEPGPNISTTEYKRMVKAFKNTISLKKIKVSIFSGTVPDPSATSLYKDLIEIANTHGIKTILDSYGPEFEQGLKSHPYLVKPNLKEAEDFFKSPLPTLQDQIEAIETFVKKYKVAIACISLGANGCIATDGEAYLHAIPPRIEEINPVGSGDALVAGLAIGVIKKYPLPISVKLGVALGTANAMRWEIGKFNIKDLIKSYQDTKVYLIKNLKYNQRTLLKEHIPLDNLIPKITHFSQ